jgi:hypothetical protein
VYAKKNFRSWPWWTAIVLVDKFLTLNNCRHDISTNQKLSKKTGDIKVEKNVA